MTSGIIARNISSKRPPGLTLVEVLVVIVILTGTLYFTLSLYLRGFGVLEANGQRLQAVQRLRAELERLRVTPYPHLPPERHPLPAGTSPVPVALGHPFLPAHGLTVRREDGSPGPAPSAVDPARGRLLFPPPTDPQTVLITYTYSPPPPPGGGGKEPPPDPTPDTRHPTLWSSEWSVTVTGTYLDAGLRPTAGWAPRKRLTVTVSWSTRGKAHWIQGHLLRTP